MVCYMGLYIWNQRGEAEHLKSEAKERALKQKKTIEAQTELILIQSKYILFLEAQYLPPLNKKPFKYYNQI